MSDVKIYSIVKNEVNDLVLATEFIKNVIVKDSFLTDNFLQILKYLRLYSVKNNIIVNKDQSPTTLPIEISLKNRMGSLQRSQIVKVLTMHSSSYEIRLDETFCHHRIIFFLYNRSVPAFTMTFGFTKINDDPKTDFTDKCAVETDRIVLDIEENENDQYWLGDDINEF